MNSSVYTARRNQNLYRAKTQVHMGPVSLSFVAMSLVMVLALLYINQITKTGKFGIHLTELQSQSKKIKVARQALEVEATRLQSLKRTQESDVAKNMVPEGNVTYAKSN